jgi:hypothetical protein
MILRLIIELFGCALLVEGVYSHGRLAFAARG